jgi:hypothetical protein
MGKVGARRVLQDRLELVAGVFERSRVQQRNGVVVALLRRFEGEVGGAAVARAYGQIDAGPLGNLGRRA